MLPPKVVIEVIGLRRSHTYHHARLAAESVLNQHKRDVSVTAHDLNENEWDLRRFELKQAHEGESMFAEDVAVLVNGQMQSTLDDFLEWIQDEFDFRDDRSERLLKGIAAEAESSYKQNSGHKFVYMDIDIGDQPAGRLVFELFEDKAPRTCHNFVELCTGTQQSKENPEQKLHYKGTLFHRNQPLGWLQGGDVHGSSGDKGESVYGPTFEDETFQVPFDKRGVLGMANDGLHSNSSQFFITYRQLEWMQTKCVAFGQLYEGVETLAKLEAEPSFNQRPVKDCVIADCGQL